ncbi:MAG: class I SAM-dependent methyltransferase [Patescibacteria group bacterium]
MTKRNQKAYDKWAPVYDADPNPHILLEHTDVLALVGAKRHEKILDAACGTGKYTHEFAQKGAQVIGIDLSKQMLEVARSKYPKIEFLQADLAIKLPFRNQQFDKINCAQALKHIKKLKPTLKEFFRVLRKGGVLVFSVTHPEMDWEGFEMKDNPDFVLSEQSDIYHHRFANYFDAFDYAGFKIDKIVQVPISQKIKYLLTTKSYQKVKGRYEIIIFKLIKP